MKSQSNGQGSSYTSPVASVQTFRRAQFPYNLQCALPAPVPQHRKRKYGGARMIHELHEAYQQIGMPLFPLNVITPGIEANDYQARIRRDSAYYAVGF